MQQASFSINELEALVEKLSTLLSSLEESDELAPEGVLKRDLRGRPLGQWLEDLWPASLPWEGAGLSESYMDELHRQGRIEKDQLIAEIAHRGKLLDKARQRLEEIRQQPEPLKLSAQKKAQEAAEQARRLEELAGLQRQKAKTTENQAKVLTAWLQSLKPQGLSNFIDGTGRRVSPAQLEEAGRRLLTLRNRVQSQNAKAQEQEQGVIILKGRADRAQSQLEAVARAAQRSEEELYAKSRRLDEAEDSIADLKSQLSRVDRRVLKSLSLRLIHSRLLNAASTLLATALAPRSEEHQAPSPDAVEDSLAQAALQGERCQRLEAAMGHLERILKRRAGKVSGALSRLREVNREIDRLESELPALLLALTSSDSASPPERAEAAAGLSTLLVQLETLQPEAKQIQAELDGLREALATGIDRGKALQEAWREAGKAERSAISQAQALAAELPLIAQDHLDRRHDILEKVAPVVELLARLKPWDMLPALAGVVERAAWHQEEASDLKTSAASLSARIPAPTAGKLSSPPLALKKFSSSLRRLSGRQVRIKRLNALAVSAAGWQELLSEPVIQAVRDPLEDLVQRLSGSLRLMAADRQRLITARGRSAQHLAGLRRGYQNEQERSQRRMKRLRALRQKAINQRGIIREQEAELEVTRRDQAWAYELAERLETSENLSSRLARQLEHSRRLAGALKTKSLERHRLLQQARHTLHEMDDWRREAEHQQWLLNRTRSELEQARFELSEAKRLMHEANAERDEVHKALAAEKTARARQALDLLEGKAVAVEVAATQSEAGRWASMAQDLAGALTVTGLAHQEEIAGLRAEVDRLHAEASTLQEQLSRISQMVALADLAAEKPAQAVGVRVTPLSTEQVDQTLDRLSKVRKRLRDLGHSTVGHWTAIAALATGLTFVAPSTPSIATRSDAPLTAPRPVVRHLSQRLTPEPLINLPAKVVKVPAPMGRGGLEVNLLPLKATHQPLSDEVKEQVAALAKKAGLAPRVLITSARAMYSGRSAVEARELTELAETARALASRHPLIFRELAQKGLPPSAKALAAVKPAAEKAQGLFLDRLYREYRNLGFSPEESLGACAANEHAAKQLGKVWTTPKGFVGRVQPVGAIEEMKLTEFLKRMTPYIMDKLKIFLRQREMTYSGDLDRYAKNLAFDMYCAAKRFSVPITIIMAIAHQETWYANVLGDADRSASPFQIYEPTKVLIANSMKRMGFVPPPADIRLQHHLTMATFMAAFHLRELMEESMIPATRTKGPRVDMNRVMKRYNGSSRYAGQVAKRKRSLAKFVKR
jgi:hypothetical protein